MRPTSILSTRELSVVKFLTLKEAGTPPHVTSTTLAESEYLFSHLPGRFTSDRGASEPIQSGEMNTSLNPGSRQSAFTRSRLGRGEIELQRPTGCVATSGRAFHRSPQRESTAPPYGQTGKMHQIGRKDSRFRESRSSRRCRRSRPAPSRSAGRSRRS